MNAFLFIIISMSQQKFVSPSYYKNVIFVQPMIIVSDLLSKYYTYTYILDSNIYIYIYN